MSDKYLPASAEVLPLSIRDDENLPLLLAYREWLHNESVVLGSASFLSLSMERPPTRSFPLRPGWMSSIFRAAKSGGNAPRLCPRLDRHGYSRC